MPRLQQNGFKSCSFIETAASIRITRSTPFNRHRLITIVIDREVRWRLGYMDKLMHDLGERRFAIGVAEIEDLRRPAIQPVSQFLDGLHVAVLALGDVDLGDFA